MRRTRPAPSPQGEDLNLCPRCGRHGYIEKMRKGSNTYILYVHENTVDGKRQKKKCYVGAERYIYVDRFNELGLTGIHDRARYKRYITTLLSKLNEEEQISLVSILFKELSNDALVVLARKLVAVIDSRESSGNGSKEEGMIDTTVRGKRIKKVGKKS